MREWDEVEEGVVAGRIKTVAVETDKTNKGRCVH